MLLSVFWIDNPILRHTLSVAPSVTVRWEKSDITVDGVHQLLVWVHADEYEAFEAGLEGDSTIKEPHQIVCLDDRRLYRLELTCEGHQASVYPLVVEVGGVLQEVTADHDGWRFQAAFPSEDALERFHRFFRERDSGIELRRLYEEREASGRMCHGTTEEQRELLVGAVDEGYLDIPRACSLEELGAEFSISSNAASERFRRGVSTLVENTIHPSSSPHRY
ncbi:hypothetical protein SAMN04487967_2476 [Natronorubrum sediminis]|uniref:HTH DNA binding domain-containing protein n=1 Tax=Natronorubrum sediminis TaxID=640943 RepID=A0A1H6G2G5_9EURY|nr:helix-turn-helix domain-containing protein [Natronorubrum sediminis]SEH16174.1 hypothetical protein SAMN04487967_2476 [Natronorubrum sediminis]